MLTRRYFAFRQNIQRLAGKPMSMWTFTLVDVVEPREFGKAWNRLLTYLKRHNPKWAGIRVYELHPGAWGEFSHGMHSHVVTNRFFDITAVLKACRASGWGRMHWQPLTNAESAEYIGKYLNKKRPACLKGIRLQATFGMDYTRQRSIVVDSMRSRIFRAAPKMAFRDGRRWEDRGWMEKLQLVAAVEFEVISNDLIWCEERVCFAVSPAPNLTRLRQRLEDLIPDGNPPPGWVPPPDIEWTDEIRERLIRYEDALAGSGPWTPALRRFHAERATLN